jgi:hypothetical protein
VAAFPFRPTEPAQPMNQLSVPTRNKLTAAGGLPWSLCLWSLTLLISVLFTAMGCDRGRMLQREKRPLQRVLFVGNSYTASGQLPRLVEEMVNDSAVGFRLQADAVTLNSADWRMLAERTDVLECIREGGYDWIVLQNHSLSSLDARRAGITEAFAVFAEVFERPNTRILLFCTWARRERPQTQAIITETFCDLARVTGSRFVPVGPAWARVRQTEPRINLFSKDGSHPSVEGIYLTACTFFVALSGHNPVGHPRRHVIWNQRPVFVDDQSAALLQQRAWGTWADFQGRCVQGAKPDHR